MKTVLAASLFFLGLVGSCHGAAHPAAEPSSLGDHMQSFTEDPYMTDEKFREKGRSIFFSIKLFQSTRLYIKGILRWLASKCAWQLVVSQPDDLAIFKPESFIQLMIVKSDVSIAIFAASMSLPTLIV